MSNYRPPAYSPLSASTVRLLMFVLLTGIFNAAHADEKPKKKKEHFIIEAQYAAGKVMPVYKGFPATSFSNVAEIHLGYQTNGKQAWNRYLNYPRLGFSLIYQNLGNNHVLGQQFSIVPTVYFSTARRDDAKVYAEIRYGLGLACFNRPYDSISNPQNFGAGEHFMWQFTVGANLHWNFSRYASLQVGGIWYHASDAHTQLPNVGVNNFAGYLGILVYPFGRLPRTHQRDTVAIEKKWHVGFRFGSGYQERGNAFGPIGGPKYPVYTASVYVMHRVAKFLLLKAGATYRYYPLYLSFINDQHLYDSNKKLKASAFIVFVGLEIPVGHFAISLEAGPNVYKPAYHAFYNYYEKSTEFNYYTKQFIAARFGANYYIFDPYTHLRNNVFIGAYVSANSGQAEFLEMNVGYIF